MINETQKRTNWSYDVRISASNSYLNEKPDLSYKKEIEIPNNDIVYPSLGIPAGFFLDTTLLDVVVK